jgi:hypothetical protein
MLGAQTIKDVGPEMINASSISMHIAPIPGDRLYDNNCEFTAWFYQSVLMFFHGRKHAPRPAEKYTHTSKIIIFDNSTELFRAM